MRRLPANQVPGAAATLPELTIGHHNTAFVFASQNSLGAAADQPADRTAFRNFLASIRLPR